MAFSFSSSMPAGAQPPAQTQQQFAQPMHMPTYAPSMPSIPDQLAKIKNAWDPQSPECSFQYYFYNRVPAEQAALYAKPVSHDQARWDAAIAARPDATSVPVLAVGFADLQRRVNVQEQQVVAYRTRMHEINEKLTELIARHDLYNTVQVEKSKARHAALAQRTLRLAAKMQVLKSRGYALRPEEEALRRAFEDMGQQLRDPAVFGKTNELWARVAVLRERIRQLSRPGGVAGEISTSGIDWERDEEQLEKIARILKGQQEGLVYLAEVLREDTEEVEKIYTHLQQRLPKR
ncbi:nucleoporin complex subunit 54-domain-containing protein [Limtongia smithiae]|uniref:nucleoporin complex subunit 54-domain-containing protein n=1 Tax=Limtongia smithiae TaxID=1125753 RepID=UPI0034CE8ECF